MTNNEAIARIREHKIIHKMNEPRAIYISEALDMGIEALKNQKKGHWIRWYEDIDYETYSEHIPHCKCSECNKEYDPYASFFIKYCSQCGAKMEG